MGALRCSAGDSHQSPGPAALHRRTEWLLASLQLLTAATALIMKNYQENRSQGEWNPLHQE